MTADDQMHPDFGSLRWREPLPLATDVSDHLAAPSGLPKSDAAILVRPFTTADAQPMFVAAHESSESLRTWMTWYRAEFSIGTAEAFVAQSARAWAHGEQFSFAIIDAMDGSFLGSVGLNQINQTHRFANVGYWVRQSAAGRGIATAAVRKAVLFALRELDLQRLEFLIPTINVASQRVAQKVGAKFEGVLRSRLVIGDRCHDAALYAVTKADFQ